MELNLEKRVVIRGDLGKNPNRWYSILEMATAEEDIYFVSESDRLMVDAYVIPRIDLGKLEFEPAEDVLEDWVKESNDGLIKEWIDMPDESLTYDKARYFLCAIIVHMIKNKKVGPVNSMIVRRTDAGLALYVRQNYPENYASAPA